MPAAAPRAHVITLSTGAAEPQEPSTKLFKARGATSAIGGSSEFHHQIVIAKLKNRDAVAKYQASNQINST